MPIKPIGVFTALFTALAGLVCAQDDPITVTPLGSVKLDATGIFGEDISGIPTTFWGQSAPSTLRNLIPTYRNQTLPEVKSFYQRIMLARLTPPAGTDAKANLLLSRIDYLISAGALDQSAALVELASPKSFEMFQRWFDVNILLEHPSRACAPAAENPRIAARTEVRIYCLAQNGDWPAAAVTLSLGASLGDLSPEYNDLLSVFLDRELFEGQVIGPAGQITPLSFHLRQELDAPARSRSLPLPYLQNLLAGYAGWKTRLEAAERLARAGVSAPDYLLSLYQEGRPSASGGVWERARAVQGLMAARDASAFEKHLNDAIEEMGPRGLWPVLGSILTHAHIPNGLSNDTRRNLARMLLLSHDNKLSEPYLDALDDCLLVALVRDELDGCAPTDPLRLAMLNAFLLGDLSDERSDMIDNDRVGEAVLLALNALEDGPRTPHVIVQDSLATLTRAGFTTEAQHLAIEILILSELNT